MCYLGMSDEAYDRLYGEEQSKTEQLPICDDCRKRMDVGYIIGDCQVCEDCLISYKHYFFDELEGD